MTSISESFNTANGTTLGPNLTWTELFGDFTIVSNTVNFNTSAAPGVGVFGGLARAETDLTGDDQFAQVSVTTLTAGTTRRMGVCVRLSSSANDCYVGALRGSGEVTLHKLDTAGVSTSLASQAFTITLPHTVRIEAQGSTIRVYVDGVQQISYTDGTPITGNRRTGIAFGTNTATARGDDFSAGDLISIPVFMHHYQMQGQA